jgi:hypothetical protein
MRVEAYSKSFQYMIFHSAPGFPFGPLLHCDIPTEIFSICPISQETEEFNLNKEEASGRRAYVRFSKSIPIQTPNRPTGLQDVQAPRISRQSAYEDGKVVSPKQQPPLPPRKLFC